MINSSSVDGTALWTIYKSWQLWVGWCPRNGVWAAAPCPEPERVVVGVVALPDRVAGDLMATSGRQSLHLHCDPSMHSPCSKHRLSSSMIPNHLEPLSVRVRRQCDPAQTSVHRRCANHSVPPTVCGGWHNGLRSLVSSCMVSLAQWATWVQDRRGGENGWRTQHAPSGGSTGQEAADAAGRRTAAAEQAGARQEQSTGQH